MTVEILWISKAGDIVIAIKAHDENEAILKRNSLIDGHASEFRKGEKIIGLDWW